MTVYESSISNEVSVSVEEAPIAPIATQLTAVVDAASVIVEAPFEISGVLSSAVDATGITGQLIQLQLEGSDGTFVDVDGMTATTDEVGAYSISLSEPTAGTYVFQAVYAGATV